MSDERLNWGLAAALFAIVLLAIALMLGFGFGLEWAAGRFAG